MKYATRTLLMLALSMALAFSMVSCGGGSGGGNPIGGGGNRVPVANAGPDQNVTTGNVVTLDGSGSTDADSDPLTYSWSVISNAGSAGLSNAAAVSPTFTPDTDGDYVFGLIVNDGTVDSAEDTVIINATTGPPAINNVPVADAGPNRSVIVNSLVTLDGSGSTDADSDPLTYSWSVISNAGSAGLSNAAAVSPTFTPDTDGDYVFGLIVNDGTVDSAEDTVTIKALAAGSALLPDTGQTSSYTATFGEDSDYTINPMAFTNNLDGTVTDEVTGLMWQQYDQSNYNWFEAAGVANATHNPGIANDVCGVANTGGYEDWLLPTKKELMSIVDYGQYNPVINSTVFPGATIFPYWTVTEFPGLAARAWYVNFVTGGVDYFDVATDMQVRCVRGSSSVSVFQDNSDGTVSDLVTGLMWEQDRAVLSDDWEQALAYCDGLDLGGQDDWRLPNIRELESISDDSTYDPAIDTAVFTNSTSFNYFWSSTTYTGLTSDAWGVSFFSGFVYHGSGKGVNNEIRCVR